MKRLLFMPDAQPAGLTSGGATPALRLGLGFKLAAEAIVAICVGAQVYWFVDAYRMQQGDSEANLYIAAVPLALGLLGWKKTKLAGFLFLGLGMLVALAGFAFGGPLGLLLGAAPGAAGACFLVSAAFDWHRSRTLAH
jgi:hypothetical protein